MSAWRLSLPSCLPGCRPAAAALVAVFGRGGRRQARRLFRRAFYRLEVALVALVWVLPAVSPLIQQRIVRQPFGVLADAGRTGLPIERTAVVLVPDPDESQPLEPYASPLRNLEREPVAVPMDVAIWMWVDADGRFDTDMSAKGLQYRLQVRRSGCLVEDLGRWSTSLLQVFVRPTVYEVGPCRPEAPADGF